MNRKLWLLLVLPITLALQAVPAASVSTCGSGLFFTSCTRTCAGPGVTTILTAQGLGSSCSGAVNACHSCLSACPHGQTEVSLHNGACASAN